MTIVPQSKWYRRFKKGVLWVALVVFCSGVAICTSERGNAQGIAGPSLARFWTDEQMARCAEVLSDWLNGQDQIKWEEEWHEKLCEPIGTLTCEDVKKIQERYCKESIKRTSTFDNTERQKDPIREELEPR